MTPSDAGALLAAHAKQDGSYGRLKLIAGFLLLVLVALLGSPLAMRIADPPATKEDVRAIHARLDQIEARYEKLESYQREKHHADDQRWSVLVSVVHKLGFEVRGTDSSGINWQSKNATAQEFEAKDDLGRDLVVRYPLPP